MSHATTTTHKAPEKVKLELLVALMATDWCHGDAHHRAAVQEMTERLLTELGGGDEVKEPDEHQRVARAAKERLAGAHSGTRLGLDQPAQYRDEQRQAPPTKAA
jgi:hypothetical protein